MSKDPLARIMFGIFGLIVLVLCSFVVLKAPLVVPAFVVLCIIAYYVGGFVLRLMGE